MPSILGGGNPYWRGAIAAGGVLTPTPAETGEFNPAMITGRPDAPLPLHMPHRPVTPTPGAAPMPARPVTPTPLDGLSARQLRRGSVRISALTALPRSRRQQSVYDLRPSQHESAEQHAGASGRSADGHARSVSTVRRRPAGARCSAQRACLSAAAADRRTAVHLARPPFRLRRPNAWNRRCETVKSSSTSQGGGY